MYLVICKNKHGLSIDGHYPTETLANMRLERLKHNHGDINEFHVRKLDLSQIDLDKLMREE